MRDATITKKLRNILIFILIGFMLGVFASARAPAISKRISHGNRSISSETLLLSTKNIAELATQEYRFKRESTFTEDDLKFFNTDISIPFTKKRFTIEYQGVVKAGLKDVSKITLQVNRTTKKVVVNLPKSEILTSGIDAGSVRVLDQTHNIINQLEVKDVTEFQEKEEKNIENKAIQNGILSKADKHVKSVVTSQLNILLGKDYDIRFHTISK